MGGYRSFWFYYSTNLKYMWEKGGLTEKLSLDYLNVPTLQNTLNFWTEGFFSRFTLSFPACLPLLTRQPNHLPLLFLGWSLFLPPISFSQGAERDWAVSLPPWVETWGPFSSFKERTTEWNRMLIHLRMVKKNLLSYVDKKLCVSEDQSKNILSQISLGSIGLAISGAPEAA